MVIRIAQLQLPVSPSKQKTFEQVKRAACAAAQNQIDLIALPEMFSCPYEVSAFPQYAEEEGGPSWQLGSALAKEYGVYVSAGSVPEIDSQGHIYNTAYVFDRTGHCIAKHRKVHLFDIDVEGGQHFRESDILSAGHQVTTFATEFGIFGLCICFDLRFPELCRLMALRGAQVILVPAAFNQTTGPAHWELTFRSQAVFNQLYTVGTAPALDLAASYHSWGHSLVVDPWGSVVATLDESAGVQITALDLDLVPSIRKQLPLLSHLRYDLYHTPSFN